MSQKAVVESLLLRLKTIQELNEWKEKEGAAEYEAIIILIKFYDKA